VGDQGGILDAENPRVQLETRDAKVIWDDEFVESAPYSRHGFQGEC
jgi:hypothetical protein